MFISYTTYSEDSIYKRRNCNLKLKPSFTKVKRIIPEKNHYRNPVQTQETLYELSRSRRNEASFKAKVKDGLQRTRQSAINKESRTLGLKDHRKIV